MVSIYKVGGLGVIIILFTFLAAQIIGVTNTESEVKVIVEVI